MILTYLIAELWELINVYKGRGDPQMKGTIELQSIITVITLHYYISGQSSPQLCLLLRTGDGVQIKPNLSQPSLQTPTKLHSNLNSQRFHQAWKTWQASPALEFPQGLRDIENDWLLSLLLKALVLGGLGRSGAIPNLSRGCTPPTSLTLGHLIRFLVCQGGPSLCVKSVTLWVLSHNFPDSKSDLICRPEKRRRPLGLGC